MKQLVKKLKKLLGSEKIIDIIIFGSNAKGKLKPKDIDLALISEKEILINTIKDKIKKLTEKEIDIQIITLKDYDKFMWITLIREGFSVKHNKYLHEIYKIKPVVLFKYSLKQLTQSKKVMFERAIKNMRYISKLSNRVVLIPIESSEEFKDFLETWDMEFETEHYGLLPLVRKESLI
ncbi:MAG: nucleotidyltransferase domain-containing protein [Candidatus Woesearchaeota archaeon]